MLNAQERVYIDSLVVGGGFGGIYQLYKFTQLGLSCRLIDYAGDLGGTWFWNRYPGALSDTPSCVYRYSFDLDDLLSYPWNSTYVTQPEILSYLNHVTDKYSLRQHMQFETEMLSADWNETSAVWTIVTTKQVFIVKYLVTALGLLSRQNIPNIPGISDGTFQGKIIHTAAWDDQIDLKNKRVAVIGCGSTGTQVVSAIADEVDRLYCFVRHPQYSVPNGNKLIVEEERAEINKNYPQIWDQVRNSSTALGFEESNRKVMNVSAAERAEIFEDLWRQGNGFRFMFGGFSDIITDVTANEEACKFIRKKISTIIKDPEKARILTPTDLYARRPMSDSGFYEKFNLEHVCAVDLKQTPIINIVREGIQTNDKTYNVDVVILATGFDAIDGNYKRMNIHGRDGKSLKQHWTDGPTSYLSCLVPGFPNLFMINGPQGPYCNIPPAIEATCDTFTAAIQAAETRRSSVIEANTAMRGIVEAAIADEQEWGRMCQDVSDKNLYGKMQFWLFGSNTSEEKTNTCRFYFGGLRGFREHCAKLAEQGFQPVLR